jgi:hypothetical protein
VTAALRQRRDWILIAFFLAGGLLILAIGAADIYGRWALDRGTATTEATVTHQEVRPCRGIACGPPYRIKYEFLTKSGDGPFTYTGQRVFYESWVRINETVWHSAVASHSVAIRYSQSDPRINEPVSTSHYSQANGWGLIVLAGLCVYYAVVVARASRRPNKSLERTRER